MKSEKDGLKPGREFLRAAVLVGAAAALLAPAIIANRSVGKTTAMFAVSLIFLNIMTGSMGLPFYRLFKLKPVRYFHIAAGVTGFVLAVFHMLWILDGVNIYGYSLAWLIGPVALGLLAVTIPTAIWRGKLGSVWRRIHQVNYAIFVSLLVKAFLIGSNTRIMPGLRIAWYAFASFAAAGLAYRVWRYAALRRRKAAAAARRAEREPAPGVEPPR